MGGFTVIYLKNRSAENIKKQNELLASYGVTTKFRFYTMVDVIFEYESFKNGLGVFPEREFPKNKIHSLKDFCNFWNPKVIGEVFVPYVGSLTFDCYFGRTSRNAMARIGKYLINNYDEIYAVSGSFETFLERSSLSKANQSFILDLIKQLKIRDTHRVANIPNSPYEFVYPEIK